MKNFTFKNTKANSIMNAQDYLFSPLQEKKNSSPFFRTCLSILFFFLTFIAFAQPGAMSINQDVSGTYTNTGMTEVGVGSNNRIFRAQFVEGTGQSSGVRNWQFNSDGYFNTWGTVSSTKTLSGYNTVIAPNTGTASANWVAAGYNAFGRLPATTSGRYYIYNIRKGTSYASQDMAVLELATQPRDISSYTTGIFNVSGNAASVSVTLSGALQTGENLYVAYSTDAFATSGNSGVVAVSSGSNPYAFSIPSLPGGSTVTYFPFTSTSATAPSFANVPLLTLNMRNGTAQNTNAAYSTYTVCTPATAPTTSTTAMNFTNVGALQTRVNWTNGNGARRIVVARAGSAPTGTPASGVAYTANAVFGTGGTALGDGFVVFDGTGSSVNVTGLIAGTTYHYIVYEYNGTGCPSAGQAYRTISPLSGSQATTATGTTNKTILIDGTYTDWTSSEQVSTGTTTLSVTWDVDYIYVRTSGGFSTGNDRINIGIDIDPGTNNITGSSSSANFSQINFAGYLTADYVYQSTGSANMTGYTRNGTIGWNSLGARNSDINRSGTEAELRIARSDIGNLATGVPFGIYVWLSNSSDQFYGSNGPDNPGTFNTVGRMRSCFVFPTSDSGRTVSTYVQIDHNNSQNRTLGLTSFRNLYVSNGTGTTNASATTLTGNVIIASGATLALGNTLSVAGNWDRHSSGIFTASNTVDFNGSSAQTILVSSAGGTETFTNLTISNTTGVSLGSTTAATVTGTLSISNGAIFNLNGNNASTVAITNGNASSTIRNNSSSGASTFTVNNSTSQTFSGIFANGNSQALSLTKSGAGTLTLSGTNTYTGTTTISAGTLTLGATNVLPITASAGDIRFTAGTPTLNLGQFSLGSSTASANSAGLLDFDVNTTVNLGAANGSAYSYYFKDSSGQTWDATAITIGNWVGAAGATAGTGAGARRILIGSSASLSSTLLNKIQFTGYGAGATQLASGEIVPRAPFFTITGSSLAHGTRCVGTAATTITYTITNTGANASGVTVTSNNSEFVVSNLSSTTINNGSTATYDVTFTPSASGARTADITINTTTPNGNTPVTSTVTGNGNAVPQGSLTANGPFCATGAGQLTWTASSGTGNYAVVYKENGGADRTASNVVSGAAFATFTTPVTSTTTYTLVSVTDANTCARTTSFTGSSATITVNTSTTSIAPGTTQNIPVSTNGTLLTVTEGTSAFTSRVWKYGTAPGGPYSTNTGVTATTYTPNFGSTGTYYVVCETTYGSPCSTTITSNEVQINVTSNSITTGTVSGSPFCAGATSISVPFSYSAPASFPSGGSCTFKAQLSNASGFFASPTDLQTVVSDASGSQSISVTIPSGTSTGSGYRIRVVSNSPAVDGTDNGTNLTISATPTSATNGSAQTICTSGTATLSGNNPAVGTGSWTVVSGPSTSSAQFGSTSVFNTVFTPVGGAGSYVVRWTISNSPCTASTADATITVNAPPTTASNGSTQTICTTSTATLSGNNPSVGTGVWTVVSGPSTSSAQFASNSVFNTVFTPAGGAGSYVVRWTISNSPCTASTADATITVIAPPTTATNGSAQTICTTGTATLSGNSPSVGTGAWSVVSGPSTSSAQFASTSVFNTVFTPAGGAGSYVVRWTISNSPCTASTADATITVNAAPTTASNGSAQTICTTGTATLSGNNPSVGIGAWTVVSGPSTSSAQFTSASVFNTVFTPAGGAGSYVVRWTISNSPCTASTADATITVIAPPTTATNGSAQTICTAGTATLSGNDPSVGTGVWTVVSGPSTSSAQFASNSVFNTVFTPAGGAGSYVVRWTISNSPCTASTADATITVTSSVGGTASASPTSVCLGGSSIITLTGNTGTIQWQRSENSGSSWTSISGATSSPYTTPSLNVATSYRAVVTSGSCASANSSTAAVSISEANQSNAGNATYNTTWSNGQNDSTIGFGAWALSATGGGGFFSTGSSDVNNANTRSWGMFAGGTGGGNVASATRSVSMGIGNEIAFSMDNGSITSGNTIGFGLQNASGQNLMELVFVGGATNYVLNDNAGTNQSTGVGYTTGGLDITVTYTAANTYTVTVTPKGGTTTTLASRTFSTQGGGQLPSQIRFFNAGAGSGGSFDLFFNSLSINNPVITTQPTATQTICTGTSTSLSVTANGTISSYQWEESANGTTGWANVSGGSGATTATYATPNLTSTTYYRVLVTGSCGAVYSSVSTVTIVSASVGGTATATASTLCTGSSTTITVSGHTGTIQWQQSADGSTGWANVSGGSGATTVTYTTPNLTSTTYYRAVVTNGTCASANSSTASVTISPASVGGTATATASTLCTGSSTTITVSGNTGTIQWQQSADGSTGWANVTGGSGATTTTYTTPNLTSTTFYRAVVTNSPCTAANSSTASVTISATNTWTGASSKDWNVASNWSCNAVPNSTTDAVIVSATNSPEIGFSGTTAANCRNLTITSGTLTMSNASSLTLASTSIFSNSGSFVPGDGTVNFFGSGTITGTVAFYNVNLSGIVSFSNAVTVTNRLRIATGGAVTTNSPTYGSSSLLQYFVGASYNRSLEWTTATSGAGYPANVQVSTNGTNTTVNMLTTVAQCSGNLTIDSGNTLNTTSNTLTVIGNVLINGTMFLAGDVRTRGNWTVGASGVQTNNGRAVFFNGASGNQTITRTSGTDVFFDYLIIDKTSDDVVISSSPATNVTLNTNTGQVLQLNNTGRLDLNGRSLFLNNSGGSIYVNGARSIISSPVSPNGTIEINQYKVIQNNSGTGTLNLGPTVTVNLNTNGNLDFGSNITTVNGILSINSNTSCFVNTNPPIYSNTSTLIYNSGGTRNRDLEWSSTTGAGYPNNVIVQNVTILEVANGSDTYRKIAGNLTVSGAASPNIGCTNCSRLRITDLYTPVPATVSGILGVGVEITGDIINNGRIELLGDTNARLKCTNFFNGPSNVRATTFLSGAFNPASTNYGGDLEVTVDFQDDGSFVSNQRAVFFTGSGIQDVRGSAPGTLNIDYVVVAKGGSTSPVLLNKELLVGAPQGSSAIVFYAATDIIDLNGFKLTVGTAGQNSTVIGDGKFKGGNNNSELTLLGIGQVGTINFDNTTPGTTNNLKFLTLNRTISAPTHPTAGFILGSDLSISDAVTATATLTAGTINLGAFNMTIGASASIAVTSPDTTKMIIASGTGELRKTFSAAGTFTYPIGDASSTADGAQYSPVIMNLTAGSDGGYIGVRVQDAKHPNINGGIADFITRYWPVTSTIASPTCNASFTYLAADEIGGGTPANYFGGRYLNPDWYCLSDVDDTNRVISSAVTAFGDFTVYNPPAMTSALTTSAATICANTSTNLQVAIGGGDAPYTVGPYTVVYNDSVLGSITVNNYISGTNIPVSPVANTTYTLQSITSSRACNSSASDTETISIGATTTFNSGSWSSGAPSDMTTTAIITSNYSQSANITACSLTVNNNAIVTIPSTFKVTLTGALTVANGSSFTLQNDSNLVQNEGITNPNTGSIIVNRNSSSLYLLDYTLWSSPVENQNLSAFSPRTLANRFYVYDTPTNQYAPIASSNNFTVAKGYLIRVPKDYSSTTPAIYNGVFTGKPNSGTITFPMSIAGTLPIGTGFNAVGNPYPSQINVHNFIDANISNITGTLYFWRKKNDQTQPSYSTLTKLGYVANSAPGGGTANTFNYFNTSNNAANTWVINVGQGFFVKATNAANLVFTNAMRRGVNNSNQFFRTSNKSNGDVSLYKLNLTSNNGFFSQMLVGYSPDYTLGVDPGIDGLNINNQEYICSSIDGVAYAIQGRPEFTPLDVVPLQYKIEIGNEYTITIEQFDGLFADQGVFIKDKLTNVIHNLKTGPYTFGSEPGTFTNRFEVVYENPLGTSDPKFNQNSVVVYKQNQDVVVNTGTVQMSNVKIYDIRGRLLASKSNINASQVKLYAGTTQQVLIVKITSDTNTVVTKKVIN